MWDSQHEGNRRIRGTAEEVKGIRKVEIPSVLYVLMSFVGVNYLAMKSGCECEYEAWKTNVLAYLIILLFLSWISPVYTVGLS